MKPRGIEVFGEVVSANPSAGIAFTLYLNGENAKTHGAAGAVGTNEFLNITDVHLVLEAGGDGGIHMTTNAAGKRICYGNYAANGGVSRSFESPHTCPRGVTPKLIADDQGAGIASCIIHGFITKA